MLFTLYSHYTSYIILRKSFMCQNNPQNCAEDGLTCSIGGVAFVVFLATAGVGMAPLPWPIVIGLLSERSGSS
ncbi:protein of unknown function [Methylacidimicrobium sp. AP8]|nr:protein of unknown function [Methylacidimicrobium sp. AP8]